MTFVKQHISKKWWRGALALWICTLAGWLWAAEPQVFSVADFGAQPNVQDDAGPGIRAALQAAMQSGGPAVVRLEAGTYRLAPPPGTTRCLSIGSARDLTLEGVTGQTELIITDPAAETLILSDCTNVTVSGLTIDYDPLPFTQGSIVAVDPTTGTFELEIEEGYPSPGEPYFLAAGRWGLIMDGQQRRLKAGASDHLFLTGWEQTGERTWRLDPKPDQRDKLNAMAAGDRFVLMARTGFTALGLIACRDCTLQDVTLYASPSLSCALIGNEGRVTLRRYNVLFRPGTTRLLSSDGDGVHCQRNWMGPLIEECTFEGMADDSINMYCPPLVIREVRSPQEVLVSGGVGVRPGNLLEVLEPATGRIKARVKATTATQQADGQLLVSLEQPVEGLVAGPDHMSADTIFNLSACGQGYIIRNNTMRTHRRHGILLRAGAGVVEGNTIEQVAGLGIVLTNEPGWPEGPVPFDVTICGNTITGCGYGAGYGDSPHGASILVQAIGTQRALAQGSPVRGVLIENNRLIDPPGAGIYVGAARGVVIRGNAIEAAAEAPAPRPCAAMIVEDCAGVALTGNRVTDLRSSTKAALEVISGEQGPQGITIKDLQASLATDQPAVLGLEP